MHPNTKHFKNFTLAQIQFISVNFTISSITPGQEMNSVFIHLKNNTRLRGGLPEAIVLREFTPGSKGLELFLGLRLVYANVYFIELLASENLGFEEVGAEIS